MRMIENWSEIPKDYSSKPNLNWVWNYYNNKGKVLNTCHDLLPGDGFGPWGQEKGGKDNGNMG